MYSYNFWEEKDKKEQIEKLKKMLAAVGVKVFDFFFEDIDKKGLNRREGQGDLACEIVGAMKLDKHFLCEAGVGIGKTYAYLVPLMLYWKKNPEPIVIATSTITLQEQLQEDIEKIKKEVSVNADVLLIKGQAHYLCKGRLHDCMVICDGEEKKLLERIDEYGCQRGDWDFDIPENVWNRINVNNYNPGVCKRCDHRYYCTYHALRMEVRKTKGFIVCNQDLLISDLKKKSWEYGDTHSILSDRYKYVVIDEAHNIENKVRNALTGSLTYSDICRSMDRLAKACSKKGSTIKGTAAEYEKKIHALFQTLYKDMERQDELASDSYTDIEKYNVPVGELKYGQLKRLYNKLYREAEAIAEFINDGESIYEALLGIEPQGDLLNALDNADSYVFWMTRGKKKNVLLSFCPADIASDANNIFFSDKHIRTIMISATLTTLNTGNNSNDYRFFIESTGLPLNNAVLEDPKESPFDYDSRAIIYYNNELSSPNNREEFIDQGTEEIIKLLNITEGKAMILFTAKSDMRAVYNKLQGRVPYTLIIQDDKVAQKEAIQNFKKDVNSVLLGTGAYWEGVSVEGIALSNLIVFKLPFPVPDPIYNKKMEKYNNHSSGVMNVMVPEMVLKLKQGIGRLIRNETDYGIVSILDPRVGDKSKSPYKNIVWDAIPIKNKTTDLDIVKKFYERLTHD